MCKNEENFKTCLVRAKEIFNKNILISEQKFNQKSTDSKFFYKSWHTRLNFQILPETEKFLPLKLSLENIRKITEFYKTQPNAMITKIPTLQRQEVINYICATSKKLWNQMSEIYKITAWLICTGVHDTVQKLNKKEIHLSKDDCLPHLKTEVTKSRMIKIDKFQIPFKNYIVPSYFIIPEEKMDVNTNKVYIKNRYVANCTVSNIFLTPPAEDLKYSFNTAETLFKDKNYFEWLCQGETASIADKTEFYRDIIAIPSELSLIACKNLDETEYFIDLRSKMGYTYSSCYAQLIANFQDYIWSQNTQESIEISLQDDSLILNKNQSKITFDQVKNINKNLGFTLNEKKTKINTTTFTFSGYNFNLTDKELKVPEKKITIAEKTNRSSN